MAGKKTGGKAFGMLVVAVIVGLIAGAVGGAATAKHILANAPTRPSGGLNPSGGGGTIQVKSDNDAIVAAVKKMAPSVVKIETLNAPGPQEMFGEWMRGLPPGQPIPAVGSGFVFDYGGKKLVMTNNHVVGQAVQARVKMTDGNVYQATVVGADPDRDIAVVELKGAPEDLVAASLGDSDKVEVGEWVIAMGNPYGYDNTVTVGVVSAKGSRPVGERETRNVIQTDAPINPGNSGGPLVDLGGNVIGINYKISSPTGATVGIGFAIPINEAKMISKVLVEGGPWIGLSEGDLMPNSRGFAAHFQLPTDKGVVILSVTGGSPAAAAGLKPGDIILAVDNKPVSQTAEITAAVLARKIGEKITFTVQRGKQESSVDVVTGKIPGRGRPGT
jgi:S1-C subfamily serine protease